MPIIATRASAAYGAGFGAVTGPAPYLGPFGAYDALASNTLSVATSSVTFNGIPAGYKHLQLRILGRSSSANPSETVRMQLNGRITANGYTNHLVYSDGASAIADGDNQSVAGFNIHRLPAATSTASVFGALIIDILDYADTSKFRLLRSIGGYDANGSGRIAFGSGLFNSTDAISSIKLELSTAANYVADSSFQLYGVK